MCDRGIDSVAASFQFPRWSATNNIGANNFDIIERIGSGPCFR
jgi:hypothetical protein